MVIRGDLQISPLFNTTAARCADVVPRIIAVRIRALETISDSDPLRSKTRPTIRRFFALILNTHPTRSRLKTKLFARPQVTSAAT